MNAFMPVIANASPLHCAANIVISALVIPTKRISIFKDDPDSRILECAFGDKADAIVTGDKEMLKLREYAL